MNGDRMRGPDIDQAGGEAARTDSAERRRPALGQASHPHNLRIAAPNHFRETQRRRAGPLHPGDARHATELLDRIETDPVVAQVKHERKATSRFSDPLDVGHDAARRNKRIRRLMHHQRVGAGSVRGAGKCAGIVDAATDPGEKRNAPADLFGDGMHHRLGFCRGQAIELTGVAIGDENMHAGVDGAIDDRLEAPGCHSIVRVKRCHENPGNAGQGPAKFGIDCHLRTS